MNDSDRLSLLESRATTIKLNSREVSRLLRVEKGHPGMFVPKARRDGKSEIHLKMGRDDAQTLFTLCHELGHFWAFATGRRTYDRALQKLGAWESTIEAMVRNHPTVLAYSSFSEVPVEIRRAASNDSTSEKPNPLSASEKQEVIDEEWRAWCFGLEIARALGVDAVQFSAAADGGMDAYFQAMGMTKVTWNGDSCQNKLSESDIAFVRALTSAPT